MDKKPDDEETEGMDAPVVHPMRVTALCEECGSVIEVKNIVAFLLSLHMQNACEKAMAIIGSKDD